MVFRTPLDVEASAVKRSLHGYRSHLPLIFFIFLCVVRVFSYCEGDFNSCTERTDGLEMPSFIRAIDPFLEEIRHKSVERAQKYLPSPHSDLLLGMVIGIDNFRKLPFFKEMLIETGTIHVVVVSGYNISLVYSVVWALLGSFYDRTKLGIGLVVAFLYAAISGFEPPVVRSWIMGSIAYLGRHYGRSFPTLKVLMVSVLIMILWRPAFLFSLSFQLSFSATLSLIVFTSIVEKNLTFVSKLPELFREDLVSTIAAQILVWPILSYYFGRVSLISIPVNALVLWTVPIGTILGGIFLILFPVGEIVSRLVAFLAYVPLDLFVNIIRVFSFLGISQLEFQITLVQLCFYYGIIAAALFLRYRKGSAPGSSSGIDDRFNDVQGAVDRDENFDLIQERKE